MCEQQFFIEYTLGWRGPSNFKATKGTILHKVLEVLAVIKKSQQDNISSFEDDIVGMVNVNKYNVDDLTEKVYAHYKKAEPYHKWTDKDLTDCKNWVNKSITFNNGMFDPRNSNILCPEQHFDFEINKPWAKYSYNIDGKKLEGNLAMKGTIDLITLINDETIEIRDYKSGRRLDWATGEEKTQEKLEKDPQLKIYHYAVKHLYPHIKNVIFTIYFINDGGPFSVCFHDSDLKDTEDMLRQKFEAIRSTKKPRLNKTWMCNKLCHFGKTTFENTHIEPIVEYRDGQVCKVGQILSKCEQIKHDLDLYGIDATMSMYKNKNHTFGAYKAPGSTE